MLTFNDDGSFSFNRGDYVRIPLDFSSGGVPTDLSNYSFKAQIRSKANNGYLVAEFAVDDTNAADGRIVLTIESETVGEVKGTRGIRVTEGYWDLQQTNPSLKVSTVMGPALVTIIPDITPAV